MWWWRLYGDSEEELDHTHLMRMAGRFARRVRGWANAHQVPVIDCKRGERKHQIAEEYLVSHSVGPGVLLILVARASAAVWEVTRSSSGVIVNLAKKVAFVNHYSFHIMDPEWGHVTIKMSGHPPFGAQVILNGHEYVAAAARAAGIGFSSSGQLLYRLRRSRGPGLGRRHLVAGSDCRAPEPGLRPLGLFGLSVLRVGPYRAVPQRFHLRLLGLPGRVQPKPAVQSGCSDGEGLRPHRRPDPRPPGCAHPADAVRRQAMPWPHR